jgi:tRNA threonylcarbamoyladenosine biosynthesis protein TsaE
MNTHITSSAKETEKLGKEFAHYCLTSNIQNSKSIIISLEGELGSGKTTFTKGFAKGLGIKENIKSPTFILMRKYPISNFKFLNFYHFDCYRIEDPKEVLDLGFQEIIQDSQNIVVIEWGNKIKKFLPKNYIQIKFEYLDKDKRKITIANL